jgi:lipoprotein signal peptidase
VRRQAAVRPDALAAPAGPQGRAVVPTPLVAAAVVALDLGLKQIAWEGAAQHERSLPAALAMIGAGGLLCVLVTGRASATVRLACGVLAGGLLGNGLEVAVRGSATDFVPIFGVLANPADVCIAAGLLLVAVAALSAARGRPAPRR